MSHETTPAAALGAPTAPQPISPLAFFKRLVWLNKKPLLASMEEYRQQIFMRALYTFDDDGRPTYNFALCGRGKKNSKTTDLILASFYRFLAWESVQGNDVYVLANDLEQARDDLSLAKKLIACNPVLEDEIRVKADLIERRDGKGVLQILPARDAVGIHGKTFLGVFFDEIHGYKSHDLFEALAHDPTRPDALTWITSYAGIRHAPGIPLYDFMQLAKSGTDPRMFFSWYSGDFTTDPALADAPPEERANPGIAGFAKDYLQQQKRRLPNHKYRRLHLNLPGAPDGAAFSADHVIAAIVAGRKRLKPERGIRYKAFVDMSGGSNDDACLGIAHYDKTKEKSVLDLLISQAGRAPFNPRKAVKKFVEALEEYGLKNVTGDSYAGQTFKSDFEERGIRYIPAATPKSDIYDALEPRLNAGEVELLDVPEMQEQLLTLVFRGTKIDHQPGDHDDYANAAAGAIWLTDPTGSQPLIITDAMLARSAMPGPVTSRYYSRNPRAFFGSGSER